MPKSNTIDSGATQINGIITYYYYIVDEADGDGEDDDSNIDMLCLLCLQMGFDKGDMKNYYVLDDSFSELAGDVESTTNVGVLGRWLFRVDGDTMLPGGIFPDGLSDCIVVLTSKNQLSHTKIML